MRRKEIKSLRWAELDGTYCGRIFHDFRRSAAKNMNDAGIPRHVAKKITGHTTDSMYERYSIVNTDDVREALERTEEYRKSAAEKVVAMGSRS